MKVILGEWYKMFTPDGYLHRGGWVIWINRETGRQSEYFTSQDDWLTIRMKCFIRLYKESKE